MIIGSSKVAATISSSLIKKRPATDSGTGDAKKRHVEENTTDHTTLAENGSTKNRV